MKNRLQDLFRRVKSKKRKIFSIYVTLGFTSLAHTEKVMKLAEAVGVDLIELGFPFSDPLADGPVIQDASYQSLKKGTRFEDALRLMKKLRRGGFSVPVFFFSYINPILKRGENRAVRELKAAGFDGFLIPDLPPEEGEGLHAKVKRAGLSMIYFLAPTSTSERVRTISKKTDDFIYYVSSRGVTGFRKSLDPDLKKNLAKIKRLTKKPVVIGFGITDQGKVREASGISQGVIVGTALVKRMSEDGASPAGLKSTERFLKNLIQGIRP